METNLKKKDIEDEGIYTESVAKKERKLKKGRKEKLKKEGVRFQVNINGKVCWGRYTLKECNKRGLVSVG